MILYMIIIASERVPYSRKLSLVQTFAELLVSPSEEIFASPSARHAIVWCTYAADSKFRGPYFRGGENSKAKISRYTVCL